MGHQETEWCSPEDRDPDNILTANLVAHRTADESPDSSREEEDKEHDLREGDRDAKMLNSVESVVIRERRHVDILREDKNRDDGEGEESHRK